MQNSASSDPSAPGLSSRRRDTSNRTRGISRNASDSATCPASSCAAAVRIRVNTADKPSNCSRRHFSCSSQAAMRSSAVSNPARRSAASARNARIASTPAPYLRPSRWMVSSRPSRRSSSAVASTASPSVRARVRSAISSASRRSDSARAASPSASGRMPVRDASAVAARSRSPAAVAFSPSRRARAARRSCRSIFS